MIGGHTLLWVIEHEVWHFVLSLSFSLALLLAAFFLKRAIFGRRISVFTDVRSISIIFVFLLSVSLALVWHFVLDVDEVAIFLRFWW